MVGLTIGSSDFDGLRAILAGLIGLPLLVARSSYGDELHLHFGERMPSSGTRHNSFRGQWVLGTRASPWYLMRGGGSQVSEAELCTQDLAVLHSLEGTEVIRASLSPDDLDLEIEFKNGALFKVPASSNSDDFASWEITTPYKSLVSMGPGRKWSESHSEDSD